MLATAIRKFIPEDYQLLKYDLPAFDLTQRDQVFTLRDYAPDIIINCAAYTNVDRCEEHVDLAMSVNGSGPGFLAEVVKEIDAVLVHISTDFVFDGEKRKPYIEEDMPNPLSVYGKSKLEGEQQILQTGLKQYFIVRTSWLYGAGGNNFVETMIRLAKEKIELKVVADQHGSPTWTEDLAQAIFALLQTSDYGIYHYSNDGECSWFDFANEIVVLARETQDLAVERILPIKTEDYPLPAKRPKYSIMSKEKIKRATGIHIPQWQDSLKSYLIQRNSPEDIS